MGINIIAHRGSSKAAPENTKSAFKQAIKDQADGIELDVHLTADNQVIVIHDPTIDRTSKGKGFIKNFKLNELKQYEFGSFFDEKFKNEKILTLTEALEIIKNLSFINIEIKKGYNINQGIEEEVLKSIEKINLKNEIIISSFNHESLKMIKNIRNDIKIAPLLYARLNKPWDYAINLSAEYLHLYYKLVNKEIIEKCHQHGIKVNVFTVDEKYDLNKMINYEVDGIITNYPIRARDLLANKNLK
ncbi:MAG: glycerophosphodiester phosphodiesterase [Halanaerobiales bacterium]|nr:glycerophosphodiester phosphodiesterase [Halanaerobiales bacterium]